MRVVPTLSPKGWIRSTGEKLELLLSYFFLSERSQSFFYPKRVASITALIEESGDDVERLRTDTEQLLREYLTAYFDNVEVRVEAKPTSPDKTYRVDLHFSATIDDGGRRYDVAKIIPADKGYFHRVMQLTNGD